MWVLCVNYQLPCMLNEIKIRTLYCELCKANIFGCEKKKKNKERINISFCHYRNFYSTKHELSITQHSFREHLPKRMKAICSSHGQNNDTNLLSFRCLSLLHYCTAFLLTCVSQCNHHKSTKITSR